MVLTIPSFQKHIVDVHPVDPMEKKPVIRPVGETCPVSPNRNVRLVSK